MKIENEMEDIYIKKLRIWNNNELRKKLKEIQFKKYQLILF